MEVGNSGDFSVAGKVSISNCSGSAAENGFFEALGVLVFSTLVVLVSEPHPDSEKIKAKAMPYFRDCLNGNFVSLRLKLPEVENLFCFSMIRPSSQLIKV